MYHNGEGVAKDYAEALKWYRLAAAQGYAAAQNNLGIMYATGQGVDKDFVHVHMWLSMSALAGDADGLKYRDMVATLMTPQQLSEAQKMARECRQKKFKGCD